MWQVITARACGTSHVASGTPCQDRETFRLVDDADGGEVAIAVVCDGAGSSRRSDTGAELVSYVFRSMAGAFISAFGTAAITPIDLREWVTEIRRQINECANAENEDAREYACTLVFALASDTHTICGQIGDGAVVVKDGDGLTVAFWPEHGEYANQTYFVTQEDSHNRMQVTKLGRASDLVLFSDGLQRLALNETQRTAHAGFFDPLVHTVRVSNELESTKMRLETFLQSERINEKTDDDKSIVIACRIA